jgi:N-carbamoyl-L-amino-acid hydrolase
MRIDKERLKESFIAINRIGATPKGGVNRPALSEEDGMARDLYCEWLRRMPIEVRVDDAGNIYGFKDGSDRTLPPVVMGSHLDTVYCGGRFDGITGVMGALEVMRTVCDLRIPHKRPLMTAVWTNEEGARFEPALLGSGIVAGKFEKESVYAVTDRDGVSFADALRRVGYMGEEKNRLREADTYLELHVEQGPILDRAGLQIGALRGIQGVAWLTVTVTGQADHAGPSPMETRRDSLMAAARMITAAEEIARTLGERTTFTVGKLRVEPEVVNVIPGKTRFSLDIRNESDELLDRAQRMFSEAAGDIAVRYGVQCEIEELWRIDNVRFPKDMVDLITETVKAKGYSYTEMVSGAGHDTNYLSLMAPAGMLFVPSIGGKSHCEEEASDYEDIARGTETLLDVALARANR